MKSDTFTFFVGFLSHKHPFESRDHYLHFMGGKLGPGEVVTGYWSLQCLGFPYLKSGSESHPPGDYFMISHETSLGEKRK